MSCMELPSQARRSRDHVHWEPISGKPPTTANLVGADGISEDSCARSHPVQASYLTPTCVQKQRGSKLGTVVSLKGRGNQTKQEKSHLRSITVRQELLTVSLYKGHVHLE